MHLYHAVPYNMTGTVLYPLNQLRQLDAGLYAAQAAKYKGRRRLTKLRIPLLDNCLWNDVLFLTAVHPSEFRKAFESAGYVRPRPFRAFEFKLADLDLSRTAVITKMQPGEPKEYEQFDPAKYAEYASVPQTTMNYWREQLAAGQARPLLYLHIPHILFRGSLETTNAKVVEA